MSAPEGLTVRTSDPSGSPVNVNPRVMLVPLIETLEGVALTVAVPPAIDNVKSDASRADVNGAGASAPKTSSLHLTVIVELFDAAVTDVIVGLVESQVTLNSSAAELLFP